MKLRRLVLLAIFLSPAVQAQVTYTAKRIIFHESGTFSQAQLEDVAQIHPGTAFKTPDLAAAAQRFSDTGYFDNVGVTIEGTAKAADVLFELKPIDRATMIHTSFANFVWLTHDEIEAAIHAKVPLFFDYLPEDMIKEDLIADALTEALAAKGIQAQVTHDTVEPSLKHPERVVEFRITNPAITVAGVHLGGVAPAMVPLVQKAVNESARVPYAEGLTGQSTANRILDPLFDAGYIDAVLADFTATPSPVSAGAGTLTTVTVVVAAKLLPGDIYRVGHITFTGTPLMTPGAFAATQKLHEGDVASRSLLLETLQPLDKTYRQLGYMDVILNAEPTLDRTQHRVDYAITVTPGEQYRLHELKTEGLTVAARAELDTGFQLKPGDLFNPYYVLNFIPSLAGTHPELHALQGYTASYIAYADPNKHTVDVVMTFRPGTMR